jgi:hypothetical protein
MNRERARKYRGGNDLEQEHDGREPGDEGDDLALAEGGRANLDSIRTWPGIAPGLFRRRNRRWSLIVS